MIKRKTVFVVGAGASAEVGLPLGTGLMDDIANRLAIRFTPEPLFTGDPEILEAMQEQARRYGHHVNPYLDAAHTIHAAMPLALSIDNFIDAHRMNPQIEFCAKVAIVQSIIAAEDKSQIQIRPPESGSINFSGYRKNWLNSFFRLLSGGVSRYDVGSIFDDVSIICFNYDRCIEHFLFHSLMTFYTLPAKEAADVVATLRIYHPYGTIGPLSWQSELSAVGYGMSAQYPPLVDLFGRIKTFTQEFNDGEALSKMRNLCEEAEQVVFLGFAYHELNLKLLGPVDGIPKLLIGTRIGISDPNFAIVREQLHGIFPSGGWNSNDFTNDHCFEILERYSKVISHA